MAGSFATSPHLAPVDDIVWRCLQCHSQMPAFFPLEVDGVDITIGDGSVEPLLEAVSSPARQEAAAAEEPTRKYVEKTKIFFSSRCWPHFRVYHHHHLPPPQYHHTILNFFIILFRCDMTKIGWMRRLIDCLLQAYFKERKQMATKLTLMEMRFSKSLKNITTTKYIVYRRAAKKCSLFFGPDSITENEWCRFAR